MVKKRDTRSRHNETKYQILNTLYHSRRYLLPRVIAKAIGRSENCVRVSLHELNWYGYIWRRKCSFKGENGYIYRYLKPRGIRVFMELDERVKIQEVTGIKISLNWSKRVPIEARMEYLRRLNR